jgi:uncharacterized protein (TIGR00251 family)
LNTASTFVRDTPDGCTLSLRIQPGAKKDAVLTLHGDALRIALSAPPVDSKANEALIAFVAEKLSLPRARVALLVGTTSRSKVLRITGKSAAEVEAALLQNIDC